MTERVYGNLSKLTITVVWWVPTGHLASFLTQHPTSEFLPGLIILHLTEKKTFLVILWINYYCILA